MIGIRIIKNPGDTRDYCLCVKSKRVDLIFCAQQKQVIIKK